MDRKTASAQETTERSHKNCVDESGVAANSIRPEKSSTNLPIGARFRMSLLGSTRNKRLAGKEGLIVGNSRLNRSVRVLFDGRRTPMSLHPDYIELITLELERANVGAVAPS
jgi:hypothetical protein